MIYIASPYTHDDLAVVKHRYDRVCSFTDRMIAKGFVAFSPIAYCHPIAERIGRATDAATWHNFNMGMLRRAEAEPPPKHIYLFREFMPQKGDKEIPDPFGGPLKLYELARAEMVGAINALLDDFPNLRPDPEAAPPLLCGSLEQRAMTAVPVRLD